MRSSGSGKGHTTLPLYRITYPSSPTYLPMSENSLFCPLYLLVTTDPPVSGSGSLFVCVCVYSFPSGVKW